MQPRTINDLAEVPEEERDWYIASDDGTFRLHPELEETCAQHEADLAELETRRTKAEAALHKITVEREVRTALENGGVERKWLDGLTAYLSDKMNFSVEEVDGDFRASVADAYGEVGVEFAVNTWLATEDADAYRPAPKATDGPLMQRLRQLRATMQ